MTHENRGVVRVLKTLGLRATEAMWISTSVFKKKNVRTN